MKLSNKEITIDLKKLFFVIEIMSHVKYYRLFILSIAQFFGLSLWFSTNAVIHQLNDKWTISNFDLALLSVMITFGFVIGGLISSMLSLSDLIQGNKLFFLSSIIGALANFFIILAPSFFIVLVLRFITGVSIAGIYPVGMKLTASHFKHNRGIAIGILLGALTAGSGLPYLFNLIGIPDWQILISLSSILAFIGGLFVYLFIKEGPFIGKGAKFEFKNVKRILTERPVLLANLGYFGHMIELYSFWVWIPIFLSFSFTQTNPGEDPTLFFSLGTFLIFLGGALANAIGGIFADRYGRTTFNFLMLLLSGSSSLIIGFFVNQPLIALIIAIVWGTTIVPDSPQYSTMITELADQSLVGTALTVQTAIGFSLTIITIQLIPIFLQMFTWTFAFTPLVIGPIIGMIAMILLRRDPASEKIAQGKK